MNISVVENGTRHSIEGRDGYLRHLAQPCPVDKPVARIRRAGEVRNRW